MKFISVFLIAVFTCCSGLTQEPTSDAKVPVPSPISSFSAFTTNFSGDSLEFRTNSPGEKVSGLPDGVNRLFAFVVPNNVTGEDARTSEEAPVAFLVVGASLKPGWYLYSMQNEIPGMATSVTLDKTFLDMANAYNAESNQMQVVVRPFVDASQVERVSFSGETILEMKGDVAWLAPITVSPTIKPIGTGTVSTDFSLKTWCEEHPVQGELRAVACLSGDGGTCNPISWKFTARWNDQFPLQAYREFYFKNLEAGEDAGNAPENNAGQSDVLPGSTITTPAVGTDITSRFDWSVFFYAFLGGLILNVMPCVLPVIGLKIISFFEQAQHSRLRAFTLNLWYSLGILSVFAVLAFLSVGLSYLFTYGLFQIVMGIVVFAMALSLMGLWELQVPAFLGGRRSGELMQHEGVVGAWFKGVITTLLAIPCGAPLLSPALVWSDSMIQQGQTFTVLIVYLVIGLGMASPYLIVGAFPELLRFLPKPGMWMENFRIAMGFILLSAVVWILYSMPLALVVPMITLLFAIWFCCWLIGSTPFDASRRNRSVRWGIGVVVLFGTLFFSFNNRYLPHPYTLQEAMEGKLLRYAIRAERSGLLAQNHWQLFDEKIFEKALAANEPVIIDFTADWCMNCKLLESTVLHSVEVTELIEEKKIHTFTADWTNQNDNSPEISAINRLFDKHGGRQVPTIMVFSPNSPDSPIVLRGLFTKARFVAILKEL